MSTDEGVNVYYTKIGDKYYMYMVGLDNNCIRVEIEEEMYNGIIASILSDLTGFAYSSEYQFNDDANAYEAENVVVDDTTYELVTLSFENKQLASVFYVLEETDPEGGETITLYNTIYINAYGYAEIVLPTEFTEGSLADLYA